jgi:ribonuclease E
MVLESNRDLVLRRLTESLARDRTRHQVSEVTSLGLVQLTRKKLGTGLIEAFSTTCPDCSGRGILLHGDPVDSTATAGRKSEAGGRRGKRGKRGKAESEDVALAKVPPHPAGEHPMFKAMAAANGRHEDDDEDENEADTPAEEVAEVDTDTIRQAVAETADEDFDDSEDEDESDEDDIDLDDDDEDEDDDDDIEVIGTDDDSDDDDSDDDDGSDDADDDDDDSDDDDDADDSDDDDDSDDEDDDFDEPEPAHAVNPAGRHRRRAAARPAGPPINED